MGLSFIGCAPRPNSSIFYYGSGGVSRNEPDFVVKTAKVIYMVETKAANEVQNVLRNKSGDVWEKAIAAQEYCRAVTEWKKEKGKRRKTLGIRPDLARRVSLAVELYVSDEESRATRANEDIIKKAECIEKT